MRLRGGPLADAALVLALALVGGHAAAGAAAPTAGTSTAGAAATGPFDVGASAAGGTVAGPAAGAVSATAAAPRDAVPSEFGATDAGATDAGASDAAPPDGGPPGWAVDLTPVAAPAYTPELGFLFAAGGVLSWNGDPARPSIPRSSATLVAGVGTVGAFLAQLRLNSFWRGDAVRVTANVDVRDMPDHYFGVGFGAALGRAPGDDTTLYRRTWWQVTPTFLVRVVGPLFLGTTFDFTGTLTRDESPGVRADAAFQRGGPRVVNSGWGATLSLDTRDVPVNAWRGVYLSAT